MTAFEAEAAERVDAERQARRVKSALAQLHPRDQEILALAASANLSTSELASALSIPVGTAKSRLARARRRLEEATARRPVPSGHPHSSIAGAIQ